MNIEKRIIEDRKKLTQSLITDQYMDRINRTYYRRWNLNEGDHPINDNGIFLTYRHYDLDRRDQSMIERFKDFNHRIFKAMRSKELSAKSIYERQHVGMAAVDYTGSRLGTYVEAMGTHVHSALIMHPQLRKITLLFFEMLQSHYGKAFHYERLSDTGHSIRDSIHYSLKGIMHSDGFYRDRDDLRWDFGPYDEKFKSQVVRVGRDPRTKQPIFGFRTD